MRNKPQREGRIEHLAQLLTSSDALHLKHAAQSLGVSEMTIRRDLGTPNDKVMLLGGYIVAASGKKEPYLVSVQNNKNIDEKQVIGKIGAGLIKENEVIFFDSGTTIPAIIDEIDEQLAFTAICYSVNTFLALLKKPHCRIILCGGEYSETNRVFSSIGIEREINQFCPDKAFISAAGVSLAYGISCFNINETQIKKMAMNRSQQRILAVDHSKFDRVQSAYIGELNAFDLVITNRKPPASFIHYFMAQDISMLRPES